MSEPRKFQYLKQVLIGIGSGVAVLALLIGGLSLASTEQAGPTATPSVSQSATPTPSTPSATPTSTLEPCLVTKQQNDPNLPNLQALVVDAKTMNVLYDIKGDQASATASTVKLLTAAVAINTLGPDYKVTTRVYQDASDPSVIYFVGAGDPTLSRVTNSVYSKAPKLSDLASQILNKVNGGAISKIVVDSSLFKGEQWLKDWPKSERTNGYQSLVSALQVDGDRDNPRKETSPRSANPDIRAGEWLRAAIGDQAASATVEKGVKPTGAVEIASVQSQPISNWIAHMLKVSDNTQAEYLAKLTSLAQGKDADYATMNSVYQKALGQLGLDASLVKIVDGSGEANTNAVSPRFMINLMKQIYDEKNGLALIKKNLPISGKTGSLAWRFKGDNKVAVGAVHAKTGWILNGYHLVGYLDAADGSQLLFAVYSLGKVNSKTPPAIDTLVTGFYRCGLALSN